MTILWRPWVKEKYEFCEEREIYLGSSQESEAVYRRYSVKVFLTKDIFQIFARLTGNHLYWRYVCERLRLKNIFVCGRNWFLLINLLAPSLLNFWSFKVFFWHFMSSVDNNNVSETSQNYETYHAMKHS